MSTPALGHIVGGGATWPLWITGALLFGGAVAALAMSNAARPWCLGVAGTGLVATVAVYVALPPAPAAPRGLAITVVAPAQGAVVTDPVVVRVCAGTAAVPGPGRLLSISVDGRQVAELRNGTAVVQVAGGAHTLRAELVTASHQQYAPPVLADVSLTVAGYAAPVAAPPCPG